MDNKPMDAKRVPNDPTKIPYVILYQKPVQPKVETDGDVILSQSYADEYEVDERMFGENVSTDPSSLVSEAKVFLDKFSIDKGTMSQIKYMIAHPSVDRVRIMPDCHRGKSCCIGFTSKLTDKVVPNFIGVDIGCGIVAYPLNKTLAEIGITVERLEYIMRSSTPMGTTDGCIHPLGGVVSDQDLINMCTDADIEANNFAQAYGETFGINIWDSIPPYSIDWLKQKCQTISMGYQYMIQSIGTLGGGNHFLEVNVDANQKLYITIHTGSRSFGSHVCHYHQEKINATKYFDRDEYLEKMKNVKRHIKDPKMLKIYSDDIAGKLNDARHTDYLTAKESYEYYFDMIFAQKYAQHNRMTILRRILQHPDLHEPYNADQTIESIHNYIDFTDLIMRKGAISTHLDNLCVISLNMRDGILLCRGKGNEDWNYSSAHGAGRLLTRTESAAKISLEDFKSDMQGIYSTSVNQFTIDESPKTYKDSQMIISMLTDSVDIIEQLKPILNIKALS
jgi:tRNA-splicing ligase RtcB